jgi:predicted secreted protein
MARTETRPAKILRRRTDGTTFARIAPNASFMSQLLVGAEPAGAQEAAPQDRSNLALGAYATGSRIAVRRLPAGYRTALDV